MLAKLNQHRFAVVSILTTALSVGFVGIASATGPTYSVAPVVSSITSELGGNLPVILGVIGALVALTIAIKAVRKFVHV